MSFREKGPTGSGDKENRERSSAFPKGPAHSSGGSFIERLVPSTPREKKTSPSTNSFWITPIETSEGKELARRAEYRRDYLVPIYFMRTSDVPPAEARAALAGVVDALRASGQEREIVNFGASQFGEGKYSSPNWYLEEAFRRQPLRKDEGYGPQIDVEQVGRLFAEEPHQQKPHWEVMVTGLDLTASYKGEYLNFVFGATDPNFPSSVQSINRFREEIPHDGLRYETIRRVLRHEAGHMFGLPSTNRPNIEENLGLHCTNICTMKQGQSVREWALLTIDEVQNKVHFCGDCKADLAARKPHFKPLPKD